MSNMQTFKTEMLKLGNKVSGNLSDFNDEGKKTSTFYTKLISLFKEKDLKDCKFDFTKTSTSSSKKTSFIHFRQNNCYKKLTPLLKKYGLTASSNAADSYIGYQLQEPVSNENNRNTMTSTYEKWSDNPDNEKIVRQMTVPGAQQIADKAKGVTSISQAAVKAGLGQTNEQVNSLYENINRIKNLING